MKKSLIILLAIILTLSVPFAVLGETEGATSSGDVSVMFTHDMHSHLESSVETRGGKTTDIGGFARLKTAIDGIKTTYPQSLLLDGGDFTMGTPYQALVQSEATELLMMGKLGYDVITLGNHEFDNKSEGLANMLNKATAEKNAKTETKRVYNKETKKYETVTTQAAVLPELVSSNINWKKTLEEESSKEGGQLLKSAFEAYGGKTYTLVERDGVKIAVFGLMGQEAVTQMAVGGIAWEDYIASAKETVKEIKKSGEADMIVCLSHAGTEEGKVGSGEDVQLAKAVPEIDLIISGHSHNTLQEPIVEGDTTIVSCGEYTENLGHVVLKKSGDRYKVKGYKLLPMDGNIAEDEATKKEILAYRDILNKNFFSLYGYKYEDVLATSSFAFTKFKDFGKQQGEDPLGNLISDAYRYGVQQAEGDQYQPVDVAVVPAGTVRGSFGEGDITVADAFNVGAIGSGPDGLSGYPLVSVYLTGKELKAMAEMDISVSPKMPVARLYTSGLNYAYNTHRLYLNRAIDIRQDLGNGETAKLENKKLYRVVGDIYTCHQLEAVREKSKGLLSIEPKDKDGNLITNFEEQIIYANGQEVKTWSSVAAYIDSFPEDQVPSNYSGAEGRKIDKTGFNPVNLLKQPNNFALIVTAIALIPIVIIVGIIIGLKHRKYKRRGYQRSMFGGKNVRKSGKPQFKQRKIRMKRGRRRF
ncbi:MAG: bifunctional UDP-sugar hydrolase/5'-nucleotidase [Anaerovoracaceae bacterium]